MTLSSGLSVGGLIAFGTFTSLAAKIGECLVRCVHSSMPCVVILSLIACWQQSLCRGTGSPATSLVWGMQHSQATAPRPALALATV